MTALFDLLPEFWEAAFETLYIVALTLLFSGIGGLAFGIGLYVTRRGGLFQNAVISAVLNFIINVFRPIPFLIFLAAAQPLARLVVGTGIGNTAAIFTISLAACFAVGRIVEQNLLTVQPGVVEAARSVGAGKWRTVFTIVLPEALGPLILGFAFIFVALVDMSAVAGLIAGGGIGYFAILYGFRQFDPAVTWAAVILIIVLVQAVQFLANWLARRVMRR